MFLIPNLLLFFFLNSIHAYDFYTYYVCDVIGINGKPQIFEEYAPLECKIHGIVDGKEESRLLTIEDDNCVVHSFANTNCTGVEKTSKVIDKEKCLTYVDFGDTNEVAFYYFGDSNAFGDVEFNFKTKRYSSACALIEGDNKYKSLRYNTYHEIKLISLKYENDDCTGNFTYNDYVMCEEKEDGENLYCSSYSLFLLLIGFIMFLI
ncbi:hypothetical protein QTN25_008832 [Entamoeba marina]